MLILLNVNSVRLFDPRTRLPEAPLMIPENSPEEVWLTVGVLLPKRMDPDPDKLVMIVPKGTPVISRVPITETEFEFSIEPLLAMAKVPPKMEVDPL